METRHHTRVRPQMSRTESAALSKNAWAGFTLIELLVVVGMVALLFAILLPGHAGTRDSTKGYQCLANTRRLMLANLMYQADNRDLLPMAFHGGYVPTANDVNKPWVTGWLDWSASSENTNLLFLLEPRFASLAVYFGRDKHVYKCPADVYASQPQRARGWEGRARSISVNPYVGRGNAWASGPGYSAGGPNNLIIYKGAAKGWDLVIPGPARTWVYTDEHPDSMNDGVAWPPNTSQNFPDAPANFHNGAAGFAFADGHSEMHRWEGVAMNKPRNQLGLLGVNFSAQNNFPTTLGDPDILWLSFTSPRHTPRTVAD